MLLLPSFTLIDNVTPQSVPQLIHHYIDNAPTSTTPLVSLAVGTQSTDAATPAIAQSFDPDQSAVSPVVIQPSSDTASDLHSFSTRPCPHAYLILLCSQKTRDARCGQSAPLLRREFERHLRPLGLYRDLHDERPGGVGIYFISHVGGHKFSANAMIYRRTELVDNGISNEDRKKGLGFGEGGQCIWLARVRPEDCEGIIKYTVLKGKVVKPERQLRGGFDRGRELVSW